MPSESTIKRIMEFVGRMEGIDPHVLQDGLKIAHLHHRVEQVIENDLATWGLTARQVEILECLYHNAENTMTPANLSDEVGLTRSAMTSALDSLEKLGHIVRMPHPTDRRMVVISLTPSGRDFIGQRLPERYQRFHRVMGGLSQRERSSFLQVHKKVLDLLICELAEQPK